jgi:hypothetical protein
VDAYHHNSKPYQSIRIQRPDKLRANQPDPLQPTIQRQRYAQNKNKKEILYDLVLLRKDPTGRGV